MMKFLNHHTDSIASGAMIIAMASIASRILGIFRDRILASEFGAGDILDSYFTAFRIPDTLFNLIVLGAISAGFIPVFLDCLHKEGKAACFRMASSVLNILLLCLLGISTVLWIFMPEMISLIAPGFTSEKAVMTVSLSRLMLLSPILFAVSAVFGGILQSLRQFFIYSMAPILYNVGIILGALYLAPWIGINGLAYGVILGAFLHMFIQYLAVRNAGYRFHTVFDLMDEHVRRILRLMLPRILSLSMTQLNLFIVTILGSALGAGSIAVYTLASNLQSFPLGVFAVSLSVAAFPALSGAIAKNDREDFIAHFSETARQILFFLIPSSVLLMVLRAQIIRVIYGAGMFDWADTISTADVLAFFALSLFAQSLIHLLSRAFFALHNTKIPLYVGLLSFGINILSSYALIRSPWIAAHFSPVAGLALAFSFSQIFQCLALWILLRLELSSLKEFEILISVFKTSLSAFAMGLSAHLMKFLIEPLSGTKTFLGIFLQGFSAAIVGIAIFVLLCVILRSEEFFSLVSSIRRRLFRVAAPVQESIEEAER